MFCGIDNTAVENVSEGVARIESYPWLGVLYYPYKQKRLTTAVVLVTRQMVVATALEIDKLPKKDFRARARVIIGHNCSTGLGVGIRDYSYHPDYTRDTYSAIALIQLETDHVTFELRPICPPSEALHFQNQSFFAMVLSKDCDQSKMSIHKMMFVSTEECQTYYRMAELGFGVYGPGCQAPARFLDYGMYHEWVQRSVQRIGRPAITKLAPNYVVLRRSRSNIQRFGPCDSGEVLTEIYTESVDISEVPRGRYYLNLTILTDIEYSCIVLKADYMEDIDKMTPSLRLRRYCAGTGHGPMCYTGMQFLQIHFFVEITFDYALKYTVQAYGREVKAIDPFRAHEYANRVSNFHPILLPHKLNKLAFKDFVDDPKYQWYVFSLSCGIDDSSVEHVSEGVARIETYPWLGVLYYPYNVQKFTTAVVLVTRQMVVASALEIDKLPKEDFRARARVVIGHNCSTGPGVPIRDYSYHPDYTSNTYSAMALIQLETDHVRIDCDESNMAIHKMMFVSSEECKTYYRRAQLDIDTLWPTYTACAKSVAGGECVWRSGAILVVKSGKRWSLLGFGVYGPGCQAPARFLDYGMYHEWVQRSVQRIGRPAITKLAPNHIVLRRSLYNIQRFGPCDREEEAFELYSEMVDIKKSYHGKYYLNLTIVGDVEYRCIVLRADYKDKIKEKTPILRLRRYCAGSKLTSLCWTGVQFIHIQLYVEITYTKGLKYSIQAYGQTVKAMDSNRAHKYANKVSTFYPIIRPHKLVKKIYKKRITDQGYPWYGKKEMKERKVTGWPKKDKK
ncbi:hypothetical protein PYW07_010352 [Mythimna separata]|uniref:Peptidase S1 domain-containing protein n=1 Tax=Mythimna separata TaxID=271217 RepID=A0AAD7YAE7_MYTSE|nr:hypothetical protein PYW07_010352 [Mythimna separata]